MTEEHKLQTLEVINNDKNKMTYGIHKNILGFLIKYRGGNFFAPATMKELKTEEEIIDLVKDFGISKEECYCRDCGKFLVPKNTLICVSNYRGKKTLFFNSRHTFFNLQTYNTNNIYRLSVCDNCLSRKFHNFSTDKQFNVTTDYSKYAFNVPSDVFNNFKNGNFGTNSLEHFISVYGQADGPVKYKEYLSSIRLTLENQISKYGQEEGTRRWNEYLQKEAETSSREYLSTRKNNSLF